MIRTRPEQEGFVMETIVPTRQQALDLLQQYNHSDRLRKHALAVEAAMRYLARKHGQPEESWGIIGLIHDLDYEQFPEQHCTKTAEILRRNRWPEDYVRAAVSHGWGICSDVEPLTDLEKTLYAVDELTGLITAAVLVRPSRSLHDLTAKSVRKKWKDKRFAAGVDRELIEKGAALLGVDLTELITDTIAGMRQAADELGLAGDACGQGETA
ncbi:MAG: HDIG domain-containing protein [Sedimentisphaerales bacterium]|nr:HDIG domain-containing protein [Sedimentisphaerales bacterium]